MFTKFDVRNCIRLHCYHLIRVVFSLCINCLLIFTNETGDVLLVGVSLCISQTIVFHSIDDILEIDLFY